ncbi:MAG: hypothetical protein ABIG85_08105 [Chloroflexota bacterium]
MGPHLRWDGRRPTACGAKPKPGHHPVMVARHWGPSTVSCRFCPECRAAVVDVLERVDSRSTWDDAARAGVPEHTRYDIPRRFHRFDPPVNE